MLMAMTKYVFFVIYGKYLLFERVCKDVYLLCVEFAKHRGTVTTKNKKVTDSNEKV